MAYANVNDGKGLKTRLWERAKWPARAREAIANGATGSKQISAALGIDRVTFYRWQHRHPEFAAIVGQPTSDRTARSAFHRRNVVGGIWAARDRLWMKHHKQPKQYQILMTCGITGDQHRRWWHQFPEYRAAYQGLPWGKGDAAAVRKVTRKVLTTGVFPPKKLHPRQTQAQSRAAWRSNWKAPCLPDREIRRIVRDMMKVRRPPEELMAMSRLALEDVRQRYGMAIRTT